MAGDCGDEIPSKSKPQSAGVTSCANPTNLLSFRCTVHRLLVFNFGLQTVNFSSCFPRVLRIFYKFVGLQTFFFNFSSFRTRTSFSLSHQTVTFHTFSANLKKILHIRLCHLVSFNAPLCYHLSSPVLKIFVAASFSF